MMQAHRILTGKTGMIEIKCFNSTQHNDIQTGRPVCMETRILVTTLDHFKHGEIVETVHI